MITLGYVKHRFEELRKGLYPLGLGLPAGLKHAFIDTKKGFVDQEISLRESTCNQ